MVDISSKDSTVRKATAHGRIVLTPKAYRLLMTNQSPKGNVLETARVAGILAAKSTPQIVPLCHPLNLEKVKIEFKPQATKHSVLVMAEVFCTGKTGVEMEALTAVSAACLTIYDMMKWAGQEMVIGDIQLLFKSGGKNGVFKKSI